MPYIKQKDRKKLDQMVSLMHQLRLNIYDDLRRALIIYCRDHIKPSYNNYKNYCGELHQCGVEISRRIDDGEYITISLYEYNSGSGARVGDYDGSFGEIRYKLSDGTTGKLKCYAQKSGGILFSRKNYTAFKTLLINNPGATISFAVNEFDCDYGKCSSWIFKMVTPQ